MKYDLCRSSVRLLPLMLSHCDLNVSRSQAKIDENFAHYVLKPKANNKCFILLNVHVKGYKKA